MIIRGQTIIDFLEGKTTDYKGRTFDDIIQSDDETLEKCHDAIQQIFPLHLESKYAHTYPIVDKDVINKINESLEASHEIRCNLVKAKKRFEKFYGIGHDYFDPDKQRKWCKNGNHNLLRITRIIRSLRLFGLEDDARDFWRKVMTVGDALEISDTTIDYWSKAMIDDDVWGTL